MLYLVILAVVTVLTRATPRRIAGAMVGGAVVGVALLGIVAIGEKAGIGRRGGNCEELLSRFYHACPILALRLTLKYKYDCLITG